MAHRWSWSGKNKQVLKEGHAVIRFLPSGRLQNKAQNETATFVDFEKGFDSIHDTVSHYRKSLVAIKYHRK